MSGKRGNGEGSIYPYKNGFAAYAWVTTPDGRKKRKYVYGKTRTDVHDKWIKLQVEAKKGPVATRVPSLEQYLAYWLREVVEPNLRPLTAATYETTVRRYIVPLIGSKRLDRLSVRDIRTWMNKLADTCQCCAQGKDAARPENKRRCCAKGQCCRQTLSKRSVNDARTVLRSALGNAVVEELVSKNVAQLIKVQRARRKRPDPWSVEEACSFLENARAMRDYLYGAYVLVLVLGLRKGEVLGLTWADVNLDAGELRIQHQLQRVRRRLLHSDTAKTEASEAVLPLPDICVAALRLRQKDQASAKAAAGDLWTESDFVFTTRYGTPVEPRNFNREFNRRCDRAGVRTIRVHDTRHTCASLLAAMDVHPRIAMQILRHSEIAVTMEVYTHVPSDGTRRALRKLGKALDGNRKGKPKKKDQGES
ncbi:tyrosine-type recombinase/integrase [Streptomyces botrytidirepellens]|uniref:Site-specific integrase n=1 Tax=Streptomyces botrytidirepellens TaxID=2486417 RepID=A0A3M8X6W3_9ACTN|nr:tyrosine-type recombinase/integrase [Streptomyces botrytidirepellens]RNG38138.1 site-specific integrase [Streptomyces botrytidirepellens]